MIYSYTQISQYLTCPRRYRHRYLDGWQEKDTRAAMLFGRAFERALAAYFLHEDAPAVLFREWTACQNQGLQYSKGDTWDRMLQQGIQLLERFSQDDRIRPVPTSQWDSLSAEPVQYLPVCRALSRTGGVGRGRSCAAARSRESWLA